MRIACIGWGSVVWRPGVLRCVGDWRAGGPALPIEFARTTQDGRLTMVLLEGAALAPTRFVELAYGSAEAAQEALAGREGSGVESIGLWPGPAPKYPVGASTIADWGAAHGFDAVVWSALRPKFRGVFAQVPENAAAVVHYLQDLDADTAARAREYVINAPTEIRTPYRAAIEATLGWRPSGQPDAAVRSPESR